ncbi:hypothetical protein [Yinghuangia soli]|uniref:Uncharacterized protein n=1 Tax=Yinghuangia soli TaxID=2908204 RepID=A0AA41Q770_9ACTN|nr:hypothetical protein [Yinghuangia soli]MCF2532481.1 hypothetical protein [Yinghuangia soli]
MDELVPFLLARTRTAGERFVVGPGGPAEHDLRRAVSRGDAREFPRDTRYRVVAYGPDRHAVYREFELTADDLGVAGPVRDEHGRAILAIEGAAVTGDPFAVDAADLATAHEHMLRRYAELWRTEEASHPRPVQPLPSPPRATPRPPAPKPARTPPARSLWLWSVPLALLLAALLVIALR